MLQQGYQLKHKKKKKTFFFPYSDSKLHQPWRNGNYCKFSPCEKLLALSFSFFGEQHHAPHGSGISGSVARTRNYMRNFPALEGEGWRHQPSGVLGRGCPLHPTAPSSAGKVKHMQMKNLKLFLYKVGITNLLTMTISHRNPFVGN